MENKKVIITGVTGMIGGIVLKECLQSEKVKQVISIVRKASRFVHPKGVITSEVLERWCSKQGWRTRN